MSKPFPILEQLTKYPESWDLIPLARGSKNPVDAGWPTKSYSRQRVDKWARNGGNVGCRLNDDHLTIDVDPRAFENGVNSFQKLCRDLKLEPKAWPRVITGRGDGGAHYYLLKPTDARIVGSLPQYPGVAFITSQRRQVVAAGSIHPDTGRPYLWDVKHPPLTAAPEIPAALLEAITKPERQASAVQGGGATPEQIAEALEHLDVSDFRDHDQWLTLMMACHHGSGGSARSEFISWSISDSKYAHDGEIIGDRWDSLHAEKNDGVTVATLNKLLRDAGAVDATIPEDASADFTDEPIPEIESAEIVSQVESRGLKLNRSNIAADSYENAVCAVVRSGIVPAWDELQQCVVFRASELPWQEHFGRVLTDHVGRLIRMYFVNRFQGAGYSPSKDNLFEALMTVAYGAKFNPVLEYLDALQWDGKERVSRLFPTYFNTEDDAYSRAVSRCFMIGAVRRQRKPGCKFDTMPKRLCEHDGLQSDCKASRTTARASDCSSSFRGMRKESTRLLFPASLPTALFLQMNRPRP